MATCHSRHPRVCLLATALLRAGLLHHLPPSPCMYDRLSRTLRSPLGHRRCVGRSSIVARALVLTHSSTTPPSPSGVPELARDRNYHPLVAIRPFCVLRPIWSVSCARLRGFCEDCPRVQCGPPPIEQQAVVTSPHWAAAPPPCGRTNPRAAAASPLQVVVLRHAVHAAAPRSSPRFHRPERCSCVAPASHSAAAHSTRCRPKAVSAIASIRTLPLSHRFGS